MIGYSRLSISSLRSAVLDETELPPAHMLSASCRERHASSAPSDGVISVMALTRVRIPKISMRQVDRYLEACVRPVPGDPSMLEIQREKVPPLFLPTILPKQAGTGEFTSADWLLIPRDDWRMLSSYLWQFSMGFVMVAEGYALADQGPSASDLEQAPSADPWVVGRNSSGDICLIGFCPCGRGGKRTKAFSSRLRAINVNQGWGLTIRGWHRLGQRISGPEFQALRPRYSNLQEFGDEEIEATLLADRARVASKTQQLKPPLLRQRASGAADPVG